MIAGVDIGLSGGVALYDGTTWQTWQASRLRPLWRIVAEVRRGHDVACWYVEAPIVRRHDGLKGQQTTGRGRGQLDPVLDGARVVDVQPATWQAALKVRSAGGVSRAAHKAKLQRIAGRLVGRDLESGEADAALIAYYGHAVQSVAG